MNKDENVLLYVAGAYVGDIGANIQKAEATSIDLIRNGFHVITPHKNTSGYEKYEDGDITVQTWLNMDFNIISRCDAIYVMLNFNNSNGTKKEIEFAKWVNVLIIYENDYPSNMFTMDAYNSIARQ